MLEIPVNCDICGIEFIRRAWNQKRCSRSCVNKMALIKHHAKQAALRRQREQRRYCRDCASVLSIYNPELRCASCDRKFQRQNLPVLDPAENYYSRDFWKGSIFEPEGA